MRGLKAATENKSMAIKVSPRLTVSTVYNRVCVMCSRTRTMAEQSAWRGEQSQNGFYEIACHWMKTPVKDNLLPGYLLLLLSTLKSNTWIGGFFYVLKIWRDKLKWSFLVFSYGGMKKGINVLSMLWQQCCETKKNLRNFNTSFFESGKGEKVIL